MWRKNKMTVEIPGLDPPHITAIKIEEEEQLWIYSVPRQPEPLPAE
jgi:hypothetical protein